MLVGGSSTGKTRACWEALELLRNQPEEWRVWHPISPSRPEAALREVSWVGPRTVVWLNEAAALPRRHGRRAGEADRREPAGGAAGPVPCARACAGDDVAAALGRAYGPARGGS